MSRIGRQPVEVPNGVTIVENGAAFEVKGPKGMVEVPMQSGISVVVEGAVAEVKRANEEKKVRSAHGLVRAMLANAVEGVTKGFKKELELNGVGFKVAVVGSNLKLALGFSHDVMFSIPSDVTVSIDKNKITIEGIDKQRVGQIAADIRELKKPEPYKGKGIKYIDEYIIRKAGKTAGSGD